MIELVMLVASVILMFKVAEVEGRSGISWAVITVVVILACGVIPMPMVRVAIGCALSFLLMFLSNVLQKQ